MIDLEMGRALLDFGRRIGGGHRAEEQLRGAVAVHNILSKHRVAYLADEVGMGKTYVALGALALFRHFDPNFRVLVIAPRENIQRKWQKELMNFAEHNVRFDDLRMRALDGRPARALVSCGNVLELVNETSLDPNRDFFVRMSSFSLPLGRSGDDWKRLRDGLRRTLPWLRDEAFDLRNKDAFKKNFAQAVCCALPTFDLLIVDEAHNLKHGFSLSGSARNLALARAFGRTGIDDIPDGRSFPGYGPRAKRVLFLSATPLEETYKHVWNQLDLFGLAARFRELNRDDVPEEHKKQVAAQFLIRRVTSIRVGEREITKNIYRREWRRGGVREHDEPITITDPRQKLIVALVQKKVSELLNGTRFSRSFQIGMLASFESFLETAKVKREVDDESVFDDPDQADDAAERDGIDVADVNRLAHSYRQKFRREMPHPKMDAVVESLASSWETGIKSLIFVRRVASVKELKKKLDERYDDWLIPTLRKRLSPALQSEFDSVVTTYRAAKAAAKRSDEDRDEPDSDDHGGQDTFFAWFFRGEGPKGIVSGANIQGRFIAGSGALSTFFADNYLMALLGSEPGRVLESLAAALGFEISATTSALRLRAVRYISRRAKVVTRGSRMEAVQAAGLELLRDHAQADIAMRADVIWTERFRTSILLEPSIEAPPDIASALEWSTFFTELRRPDRERLREQIWPAAAVVASDAETFRKQFREEALRADLLSVAARLGHASIDLYISVMVGRPTLYVRRGAGSTEVDDALDGQEKGVGDADVIAGYLDLLDHQRQDSNGRSWGALDELSEIAGNLGLIVDVNLPDTGKMTLGDLSAAVVGLLRRQQPIGGMSGQVNQTLIRQFRMPGYPFVLVTTDLLQEGEDLHTFCSSVQHYGMSWTPSAMEQRIGRIDRVRSQTDRRLSSLSREPTGADWLQVYFPYLEDTVEILQVKRVLDRMDTFLRLMHEDLFVHTADQRRIDLEREILTVRQRVEADTSPLKSAFPLPDWATKGSKRFVAVGEDIGTRIRERFTTLTRPALGGAKVEWDTYSSRGMLLGTAKLASGRVQPFTLILRSEQGLPVIRCISPIGRATPGENAQTLVERAARLSSRIGAIHAREARSYDLTVEDDVVLGGVKQDAIRVGTLIRRVTEQADRLEQDYFEDGRDEALAKFEVDLRQEGTSGA